MGTRELGALGISLRGLAAFDHAKASDVAGCRQDQASLRVGSERIPRLFFGVGGPDFEGDELPSPDQAFASLRNGKAGKHNSWQKEYCGSEKLCAKTVHGAPPDYREGPIDPTASKD